jgi:hypothetical protein
MSLITRKVYNGRTTEDLIALLSAVASAILAALFIAALYQAPVWNRSDRPVPRPLVTLKLVPPPASAKPAMVFGENR